MRARGVADYVLPAAEPGLARARRHGARSRPGRAGHGHRGVVGLVVAAVAGVAFAVLIALWPFARRAVYPLLVVSQTIPALVLAPIFIVWLGFGLLPKVVVVALVGFFPIVVSTVDGLVNADPERIDLVRSFGGEPLRSASGSCRCPSALPSFFAGLQDRGDVRGRRCGDRRVDGRVRGARARDDERITRRSALDRVLAAVVVVALVIAAPLRASVSLLARLATPWTAATVRRRARTGKHPHEARIRASSLSSRSRRRARSRPRVAATTRRRPATATLGGGDERHARAQLDAERAPPRCLRRAAAGLVPRRGHRPRDHRADRSGRRASGRRRARPSSAISMAEGVLPARASRASRSSRSARSCRSTTRR